MCRMFCTLLLLFFSLPLYSADLLLQGIHEYQAGSPDLATVSFRDLLQEKLSASERAVVLYNLATALAKARANVTAKKLFLEINPADFASQTVHRDFLVNQALLALRIGSVEDIKEAETIAKELGDPFEKAILEEVYLAKLKARTVSDPFTVEKLIALEGQLFDYLIAGGEDPLYFKSLGAVLPAELANSQKSGWELYLACLALDCKMQVGEAGLTRALELYVQAEFDENWPVYKQEKKRLRDFVEMLIKDEALRASKERAPLLKLLLKHLSSFSAQETMRFYRLLKLDEKALYKYIWERNSAIDLLFAFEILHEKLEQYTTKSAKKAAEFIEQAAKEKEVGHTFLLSWLEFDAKDCLKYLLDHASAQNFAAFIVAWEHVKDTIATPEIAKRIDADIKITQNRSSFNNPSSLVLLCIQYWLFHDRSDDSEKLVRFGIQFEKQAMQVSRQEAGEVREVTLEMLKKLKGMHFSQQILQEIKVVEGIVQVNEQFELQRALHSRVLELLEKIAPFNQKKENTTNSATNRPENQPAPNMPETKNLKISPLDATRLIQDMQARDESVKEAKGPVSRGGAYPW